MRMLTALLALAVCLPAQAKPDEAKAIRDFQAGFHSTPKNPKTLTERLAALSLLAGHDSGRLASVLVAAFEAVEAEIAAEDAERLRINDEMRAIIKGKEHDEKRVLDQGAHQRFQELQKLSHAQRARLDNLRQIQAALGDRIRDLRQHESLSWLVKNVLVNRKYSLLVKMTVCSSAGGLNAELLGDFTTALQRAKEPADLLALLTGLGHIGPDAKGAGGDVAKLLAHKDPLVVDGAAVALGRMRYVAAVPQLIELLERGPAGLHERVGQALTRLTGQPHGTSASSWRGWYDKEGKDLIASGKLEPPAEGSRLFEARPGKRDDDRYYMGIPQDGEAIVYVIDSSGSMKQPVKWTKPGGGGGGGTSARPREENDPTRAANTRLEACKMELIDALEKLPRTKTFNVVWYSDLPHAWKDGLQKALPASIKEAQDWVRALQPNSMTNIHDALQVAFGFASGRGLTDKAYYGGKGTIGLDTIFLLSDGSPTKPDGSIDDYEKILVAVRRWNPLKHVTVHAIGIGDGINVDFMSRLARENNGEFKHFTDDGKKQN